MKPKHKAAKVTDPLDTVTQADPLRAIALMLWKQRHREPDMYVKIEEADIRGFDDCVNYLKVIPTVKIVRPQGLPAQEAVPATAKRRAIPGREAQPPRPYVMITLVDTNGDMIRPVENNEADYDIAREATKIRKARDQAPELAQRLMRQAQTGEFSLSDMQDASDALLTLAGAI